MSEVNETTGPPGNTMGLVIGGLIILACVAGLIVVSGKMSMDFYSSVGEFLQHAESHEGKVVRLRGLVKDGSVEHDSHTLDTKFLLVDHDLSVRVEYNGVLPSSFVPGTDLVVQGTYHGDRQVLVANQLMFKCPSKYEAKKDSY